MDKRTSLLKPAVCDEENKSLNIETRFFTDAIDEEYSKKTCKFNLH